MTLCKAQRLSSVVVAMLMLTCVQFIHGQILPKGRSKAVTTLLQTSQHVSLHLKKAGGEAKGSSKGAKATPASELCGKSGKGGRYCWPMKRYPILGMKLSPFFIGCCQPCPEKMANDLSFLQLPKHVHAKAMERFSAFHESFWSTLAHELGDDSLHSVPKSYRSRQSQDNQRKRSRNNPDNNPDPESLSTMKRNDHRRKLLGLVPALYGTGTQLQNMLKCCNICPEQFYSPADYEDTTVFLSLDELKQYRVRGSQYARQGISTTSAQGSQVSRGTQTSTIRNLVKSNVGRTVSASSKSSKTGAGFLGLEGGDKDKCCKICPSDRFPYRGVTAFGIGAKEAFVEIMEKGRAMHHSKGLAAGIIPALNVGQSGCCPVCPVSQVIIFVSNPSKLHPTMILTTQETPIPHFHETL